MSDKRADGLVVERIPGLIRLRERGKRSVSKGRVVAELWRRREGWKVYLWRNNDWVYIGIGYSASAAMSIIDAYLEDTNYDRIG